MGGPANAPGSSTSQHLDTVLVTGAAMGIGRGVAEVLAAEGKNLVLLDLNAEALNATVKQLGGKAAVAVGSVTSLADCERAVALAVERFGGLGGVSHNARHPDVWRCGVDDAGTLGEDARYQPDRWLLLGEGGDAGAAAQPRGHCAHRFGAGHRGAEGGARLRGLQARADRLVTGMAMDEAENGVRVLGVAPGSVETPMLRWAINQDPNPAALDEEIDAMHPIGRRGQPREIGEVIAFLLSDKASFMTGETVRVDGGMLARIPGAPHKPDGKSN